VRRVVLVGLIDIGGAVNEICCNREALEAQEEGNRMGDIQPVTPPVVEQIALPEEMSG
jgi:hypothetical protein